MPAVAIGGYALDLATFSTLGGFSALKTVQPFLSVFLEQTLNPFAQLGQALHREVRQYLRDIFLRDTPYPDVLRENHSLRSRCLFPLADIKPHIPMQISHFTDFYAGINHATNAGTILRGQNGQLRPNYAHLPIAYHGRASSVVISGTPVKRPWGQIVTKEDSGSNQPTVCPCRALDFELELGAFVCGPNKMGDSISIQDAENAFFGFVLLNDWSARDIQQWESTPLGPFNGKSFATSISSWVVLVDALEPFRCSQSKKSGDVLKYLQEQSDKNQYDLNLQVDLTNTRSGMTTTVCRANSGDALVWSFPQMLAHQTLGGCPVSVGDLLGSGTISGTTEDALGCLLERNLNGQRPFRLQDGEERMWLEDGDTVTLRGWAGNTSTGLVGFGECFNTIIPADKRTGLQDRLV